LGNMVANGNVTFNNGVVNAIDTLSGTGTLDIADLGSTLTTLEVAGTTTGTGPGASSTFGGTLLGNGNLEAFNSTLDLTGNISAFTGSLTANTNGNIVVSSTGQLDSLASLNINNDHSITLAYGNLNGNAVDFSGNLTSNSSSGILFITGNHAGANLGSLTNAITISDNGAGVVTTNIIDAGGGTNTLTLAGALTSNNTGTGGSNTLQLQNGNFVLANANNSTTFTGNGNLQIGDGAGATVAQFSSADNLPGAGVGLTLDLGELAYTGSAAATVANNITDSAGTNNLIDAGAQKLTLSGSITNTIGILTLQNGTFVLGGTNGAVVNPTFSGGTMELGNGGSDTSTIADFASATNLPSGGASILLNGATLAYNGGATNPVTVLNAITIGDAPTINIMDAGGASETLSGLLTDSDGSTLILQNGTIVLGNAGNSGGFTTGTLQIGNTGVATSIAQFAVAGDLPAANVGISFDNGELQYQGAAATTVTVSNNLSLIADGVVDGGSNTGLVTLAGELMNTSTANTLTLQNGTFALTNTGDAANNNTTFTAGTLAIGDGTGTVASVVVHYNQASSLPGINAGLVLNDGTLSYTGTGSSAVVNALGLTGTGNGVVDAGGQTLTLSGSITDNSNTLTLQNGHLILNNAVNSTDFVGGNLQIGNGDLATTVSAAGVNDLPSGTVGDVVGITLDAGTLQQTAGYTVANTITLEKNALAAGTNVDTLDVDGNTGIYNGAISDGGAGTLATLDLTSSSAAPTTGTVILNGPNTYAGATNVLNGVTAVAGNSNAFGAAATTDILTVSGTGSAVDSINSYNYNPNPSQNKLLASATGEVVQLGGYTQDTGTNLNLVAFGRPVPGQPTSGTYDSLNTGAGVVNLNGDLNLTFSTVSNSKFQQPADFDTYKIITDTNVSLVTPNTGVTAAGGANTNHATVETGDQTYGIGWLNVNPNSTNLDLNYYENSPTGNAGNQTVTIQTLFLPDAQTPNQQAIATYIDQYVTPFNNVPLAMQNALANLSLLTPAQIAQVLNSLTPQAYSGLADEAFQNSTFLNQQVFQQTQDAFESDGFNTSGLSMLDTKVQNPFAISMESQMKSAQQQAANSVNYMDNNPAMSSDSGYAHGSGFNGFVLGTVTFDHQANNGTYSQNDTSGGVLAGLDYRLNRNWVVGALFNWNYTGGTVDNINGGQQVNSYTPGLFAGYRKHNFYVDALATYTYNTYRINRNIDIPGSASVATAEPHANQYDAGLLAGYNLLVSHGLKIGPAAGLGFTQMNISGFNETGSPFDLSVSKQHADSLRTLLGAQGQYTFSMPHIPLPVSLNFDAFWQHECLNSARGITSSFSQISGGQFLYGIPGPARNSALLGLGVSGYLSKGTSLFVNYQTQIGSNSQFAQTVMAGVAVRF
ncbi:MAG: autotransporter domain-containing protein, partial [Planctomycetia bacterium]|nr:autotransporter domain-containing protein [Planctomycetia bacterium]